MKNVAIDAHDCVLTAWLADVKELQMSRAQTSVTYVLGFPPGSHIPRHNFIIILPVPIKTRSGDLKL